MHELKFTPVTENNRALFHSLMQRYAAELDEHQHRNTDSEQLRQWTDRIIEKQFDNTRPRHLKLCYIQSNVIGFFYGDMDKVGDEGFTKIGYGCILEFYVLPEYRRHGYGKEMFLHLQSLFRENDIKMMYLTADPVTGKPFWEAMGFTGTGEICPDNGQEIYEKAVPCENIAVLHVKRADTKDAAHIAVLYSKNIDPLHGTEISCVEWREALSEKDEDEAHFLIYRDSIPVAWLKINGLSESDSAWISMLAVAPDFQRQGIGQYAVRYAEEYCKSYGKKKIFVKTTMDNTSAQKLYQKCGYIVCDKIVYTTSDGINRNGVVFSKKLTI